MSTVLPRAIIFSLFILVVGASHASTVQYAVNNITGNTWQYDYTVINDSLTADIEEVTIYFDLGVFANLNLPVAPGGWDALVIQPDPALPDDGFYDALALGPAIAPGDQLGGFSVQFDYLGAGTPGSQFFEIVNPQDFSNPLDTGFTTLVPLPASLWLFCAGLLQLFALHTKRKRKTA